ncbi:MAG: sulfatase-like hydrolase/transferase [Acidobacteriota bacterium]
MPPAAQARPDSFTTSVLALALAAALGGGCAAPDGPVDHRASPNLLFVLYDDLDIIGDLEPYGADPAEVRTPFANVLANAGKRFERFYVNAPVCSPTRMALLSGHYPTRFGFTWATEETSRRGLPGSGATLPRLLGQRGYLTGAFGKWHIGSSRDELLPLGVGFDRAAINCTFTNFGRSPANIELAGSDAGIGYKNALFCDRPGRPLADSGRSFATTYTVDKALELITDALDAPPGAAPGPGARPFYAQVWLHAPHTPLTCPPGAVDCPSCDPTAADDCDRAQKRRIHHAMVSHAESQLARLHRDLEERGVWENTLVVFASDNGGVGGWQEPSKALRGAKGSLYERGVRTPLIIAGPGVEAGVVDVPVAGLDLLPTLGDLLDLPTVGVPGLSFADLLRGERGGEARGLRDGRALFWELRPRADFDRHTPAGRWLQLAVQKTVDGRRHKLVKTDLYAGGAEPQLFDLDADPAETRDLGPERPAVRRYLRDLWRRWRQETTAFRPDVDPPPDGDGALRFDGQRGATVADHPALTVGRLDFTVAFELTVGPQTSARPWVAGRDGAWSLRLEDDHLVFAVEGHRPQRLVHPKVLAPGEAVRVVATITNRRGLSLFVDDRAVWKRARFGSIAESDAPIQLGLGPGDADPFVGAIGDLVFYPVALGAADLPLNGLGRLTVEGGSTASVPLGSDAAAQHIQARVPVRAPMADGHSPFELSIECLRRGGTDWHPRAIRREDRIADAEGLVHGARHLCPAGSDAVRLAVVGRGGVDLEAGAVDLGRLGAAVLDLGFEAQDREVEALRDFRRSDVAKTGLSSLRLPPGAATPIVTLPIDGAEGLDVAVWARTERAETTASIQLELSCLDVDGEALETPTGNRPEKRRATTTPGRVDNEWRRFQLLYSCPHGPEATAMTTAVGLRILGSGAGSLLVDDLTVVIPSSP